MDSSEYSPQSKRHSYPVILSYSETLSVLSENQREYNRKASIKRSKTPTLGQGGSDEERRQKIQQALDWLSQELKDMFHQDKFLLRQFKHLNRSIQELKDTRDIQEETETKPDETAQKKSDKKKGLKAKAQTAVEPTQEENGPIIHAKFKLEDLEQARIRHAQKRELEMRVQEELAKQQQQRQQSAFSKNKTRKKDSSKLKPHQDETSKVDKRSLNSEYDSDYGSDQSVDKFEVDNLQSQKKAILNESPKILPKQQRNKRWSWWK